MKLILKLHNASMTFEVSNISINCCQNAIEIIENAKVQNANKSEIPHDTAEKTSVKPAASYDETDIACIATRKFIAVAIKNGYSNKAICDALPDDDPLLKSVNGSREKLSAYIASAKHINVAWMMKYGNMTAIPKSISYRSVPEIEFCDQCGAMLSADSVLQGASMCQSCHDDAMAAKNKEFTSEHSMYDQVFECLEAGYTDNSILNALRTRYRNINLKTIWGIRTGANEYIQKQYPSTEYPLRVHDGMTECPSLILCSECQKPIPVSRRLALPETKLCVECAKTHSTR